MFLKARKTAQVRCKNVSSASPNKISLLEASCLPQTYTLRDIYQELIRDVDLQDTDNVLQSMLVIASCMELSDRISQIDDEEQIREDTILWVAKVLLPDEKITDENYDDDESAATALQYTNQLAMLGLQALDHLIKSSKTAQPSDPILLTLLVYTLPVSWTNTALVTLSSTLLSPFTTHIESPLFIHNYLLASVIRPLFRRSAPKSITMSSRAAMPSSAPTPRYRSLEQEKEDAPWRYSTPYSTALLTWIVNNISKQQVRTDSWPLLVPPLLTLLDTPSYPHRLAGLRLLPKFLSKMTAKTLETTGLGNVFEDAIHPSLLFLPSLTPIDESICYLNAAYPAIFALLSTRYNQADPPEDDPPTLKERRKSLDRLYRQGIARGLTHCSEIPSIVEILLSHLSTLISELGIYSVIHLKTILPTLDGILTNPFITSTPSLLLISLATLKTLLQNSWPRISALPHRHIMLKTLALCHGSLSSASLEHKSLEQSKASLLELGRLFVAAVEAGDEQGVVDVFWDEIEQLLAENPGLRELFGQRDETAIDDVVGKEQEVLNLTGLRIQGAIT